MNKKKKKRIFTLFIISYFPFFRMKFFFREKNMGKSKRGEYLLSLVIKVRFKKGTKWLKKVKKDQQKGNQSECEGDFG